WARYSSRTVCASVFTRSASSKLPRMRSVRACIVLWTAGKANLAMSMISTMNERKPQMISFLAGRIGLGAFPKASTSRRAMAASRAITLLFLLVFGVHGAAQVDGGQDREDEGLQHRDEDLERGEDDEHHGRERQDDGHQALGEQRRGQHGEGHQQQVAGQLVG